jgi:hypothetical protein
VALAVALAVTASSQALALKEHIKVTPLNSLANGFAFTAAAQENGTLRVTIVRDLSKARSFPADSPYILARTAELTVSGESGLLLRCQLNPGGDEKSVVYSFDVAKDRLDECHFSVYEGDVYKDRSRAELPLGGGTFHEFRLGDFVVPQRRLEQLR